VECCVWRREIRSAHVPHLRVQPMPIRLMPTRPFSWDRSTSHGATQPRQSGHSNGRSWAPRARLRPTAVLRWRSALRGALTRRVTSCARCCSWSLGTRPHGSFCSSLGGNGRSPRDRTLRSAATRCEGAGVCGHGDRLAWVCALPRWQRLVALLQHQHRVLVVAGLEVFVVHIEVKRVVAVVERGT